VKKIFRIFPALLLVTSLAANVALFLVARNFYTRESQVRLHPIGSGPWPTTGHPGHPGILLMGDYRIRQWNNFTCPDHRIINAGLDNETTAQILLRTSEALTTSDPAVVVIQAGINDLKRIPLMPDRNEEITSSCLDNLMEMAARSRATGAHTVMLSVLPAGRVEWTRRPVWSDAVAVAVKEVNRRLAARVSTDPGIRFVDLTDEVAGLEYVDTLHFNPSLLPKNPTPNHCRNHSAFQATAELNLKNPDRPDFILSLSSPRFPISSKPSAPCANPPSPDISRFSFPAHCGS
jgi:lysophospholipase L1-like esterase